MSLDITAEEALYSPALSYIQRSNRALHLNCIFLPVSFSPLVFIIMSVGGILAWQAYAITVAVMVVLMLIIWLRPWRWLPHKEDHRYDWVAELSLAGQMRMFNDTQRRMMRAVNASHIYALVVALFFGILLYYKLVYGIGLS